MTQRDVVDIRVLGSVQATRAGSPMDLGTPKERLLLALLLIVGERPVPLWRIVECLWDEDPPGRPEASVQAYISHLRRLLSAGDRLTTSGPAGVIERSGDSYQLVRANLQVDADRFLTLVSEGSEAADRGDPRWARTVVGEALALWRGAAYGDLGDVAFLVGERNRLEEVRHRAVEIRFSTDLELGRHADVVAELARAVEETPYREHLWTLLSVALYRSGRQVDALDAVRRGIDVLRQEAGLEAIPELRDLEAKLLAQEAILDAPGVAAALNMVYSPRRPVPGPRPVPLPPRLRAVPPYPIVGRDPEVARLDAAYRAAAGGCRQIVLISGEPGIGKTVLAAEAARAAHQSGASVLLGRCDEEGGPPYQPFVEALEHYVVHATAEELAADVEATGSEVALLVPALRRRLPGLPPPLSADPETERYVLQAGAAGLLTGAAMRSPVVLVLEDLQWADQGSLQVLRRICSAPAPSRLLVIATYREPGLEPGSPFGQALAAIYAEPGVSRTQLSGLDAASVLACMAQISGNTLERPGRLLAEAVWRETGGNPLFVTELVRHLGESGAVRAEAPGRWTVAMDQAGFVLPSSLQHVIAARVARLGRECEEVLGIAAVIGAEFDLEVVAQSAGLDEDRVLRLLDSALAASLVREVAGAPGRYEFSHSLVQHALYRRMSGARRVRAHHRIAEVLEALGGASPLDQVRHLARHWFACARREDLGKALAYSRQAADAAMAALAPAEAARYYSQALDLRGKMPAPDPGLGLDLLIALGIAEEQCGDQRYRGTLLDASQRARALGDQPRLARAVLANSRVLWSKLGAVDYERIEMIESALVGASDPSERGLLLATLCAELHFGASLERRRSLAEQAVDAVHQGGDNATIVRALRLLSGPLLVPHLLDLCVAHAAEALDRAECLEDPGLLCIASGIRAYTALHAGDVGEHDRCLETATALAGRIAQPTWIWLSQRWSANRALVAGDTDRARELADAAFEVARYSEQPDAAPMYYGQLASVCHQRGSLQELMQLIPVVEKMAAEAPEMPALRAMLALGHAEAGQRDAALAILGQLASTGFVLPLDVLWLPGILCASQAVIDTRATEFAAPLRDLLAPFPGQISAIGTAGDGLTSHCIGGLAALLGRWDEAEAQFSAAAELCARIGARFFAARTDLAWGEALLARGTPGDKQRAAELLSRARTAAAEHGYAGVERRATRSLEAVVRRR